MRKWTPVPRHVGLFSYDTQKGKRYGVRRGFKNADGKRDEFHPSGFRSWHDADHVLKDFEAKLANGKLGVLSNRRVTVADYFDRMSNRKLKYDQWRESSYKQYTLVFNTHVRDVLGDRPLQQVTRIEYQSFLDDLDEVSGLARTYIDTINKIMMIIFNDAEKNDVIDKNRLKAMQIHGNDARKVDLTPEEFDTWTGAADKVLSKYQRTFVYVDALGLRIGECQGLRTSSIAFSETENVASITIDLQRGPNYPVGGPLKNKSSYRTIWVHDEMVDLLRYAVLTSDNLRSTHDISDDTTKWLWLDHDGTPLSSYYARKYFEWVNEESGIEVRPHMLRHYFATQGVIGSSQIDTMKYLGHKNLQMTADYVRPTEAASLKVFDAVNPLSNGKNKSQSNYPVK